MSKVRHGTNAINEVIRDDGDMDAIVYRINNTGDPSVVCGDRYTHTITHNLTRVPIGCEIIMRDDFVNMRVLDKDDRKLIVQFDTARADVTLRIW